MLRSRYCSGIYSDTFRNALRHHFDDGADFESLLKYAHNAEQEPSSAVAQQSVAGTQPDKLDQILAQLKDLNARVQELERKCSYGDSSVPMGVQRSVAPASVPAVPPPVNNSRPFKGKCYDCGRVGARHFQNGVLGPINFWKMGSRLENLSPKNLMIIFFFIFYMT